MSIRKWIYSFLSLFLFTIAITATAQNADSSNGNSNSNGTLVKKITLGDQEWTLANDQENKDLHLGEYVTNGETIDNWTQLVTYQRFKFTVPSDLTPEKFGDTEIQNLNKQGYKPIYQVIESSPDEAIIEFKINEPKKDQQDELQRIIITPEKNLIVLHYVIRKPDMGDDERKKWIGILKTLDLTASE